MNANTIARSRALHVQAEFLRDACRKLVAKHGSSMETAAIDQASDVMDHIAKTVVSRREWDKIVAHASETVAHFLSIMYPVRPIQDGNFITGER